MAQRHGTLSPNKIHTSWIWSKGPLHDYVWMTYSRESSVTSMLKDLEWQSLDTRRALTRLVLMFKISHSLVDIVWQGHLTKTQHLLKNTHTLSYQCQSIRTRIYDLSFFPWSTKTWNTLLHNILDCCKLTTFKTKLMKYWNISPLNLTPNSQPTLNPVTPTTDWSGHPNSSVMQLTA